jgi:cyanophycin synthetase
MPALTHVIERDSEFFNESRRLTGPNFFFVDTAVVLEALGIASKDIAAHARWRVHVAALTEALGWHAKCIVRVHSASASLVFSAPMDQLYVATEVNEWAWEMATSDCYPALSVSNACADDTHNMPNDIGDIDAALIRLRASALSEKNPALIALQAAVATHNVALYADDDAVSIGAGASSMTFALSQIPAPADIDFSTVSDIPVALVTGSNGKTTTVRLLAAMLKAHGATLGYSSTEGVVIDGEAVTSGDYSGPAGARTVLRDKRVTAAVLECARGGILRRGLAVREADVAVVTNVSADHFGEYGIDNLDDLADAKLTVSRALREDGVLVLNGKDALLMRRSKHLWPKIAVFARDFNSAILQTKRAEGGVTCGVDAGQLKLSIAEVTVDLGSVAAMPLTANVHAIYNIDNIAAATLAAYALGVPYATISTTLKTFGASRQDNPGRLEQWNINGVHILIDYAHNPAGLAGLLDVANGLRVDSSRLGLLLGQAGNRENADIDALANTAARYAPNLIVLKDIEGFLRGRADGEIAAMMARILVSAGVAPDNIKTTLSEFDAAKQLVNWASAGDVVVLPMHGTAAKQAMRDWLDDLE